jgi:hypothetical protein
MAGVQFWHNGFEGYRGLDCDLPLTGHEPRSRDDGGYRPVL